MLRVAAHGQQREQRRLVRALAFAAARAYALRVARDARNKKRATTMLFEWTRTLPFIIGVLGSTTIRERHEPYLKWSPEHSFRWMATRCCW